MSKRILKVDFGAVLLGELDRRRRILEIVSRAGFVRDDTQRLKRSDVTTVVAASLSTYFSPKLGAYVAQLLEEQGWRSHRVSGTWYWRARREAVADRLPAPPEFATDRRKRAARTLARRAKSAGR